ncbi:MAG TPA: hypothetical protein VE085_11000 [Burkholderiales bacterium]|nr:hypothetical protein [Burkholderiales bacterium]
MRFPLLLLALCAPAARADLGINLYGASYHFDRDKAKALGLTHEFNPGLGARYRRAQSETLDFFADAGFYSDSKANTAGLLGGGGLWHATEGLRLGGGLVLLKSDTYNFGKAFIAPVPVAAYEWRRVSVSMVYFPKWRDFNRTNQVGFWLTFWLN